MLKSAVCIFLFSVSALLCADTLYVDCRAEGEGDGSAAHPFRTIQAAADVVNLGDTVVIAPGIYFETVRLRRFGTEKKPVTFRADRIQKNRVVISGADPAIRRGEKRWKLFSAKHQIYEIPHPEAPARILCGGVDLFPYQNMNALSRFEAKPGIPGPRHGFYYQKQSERLFVRLRADGKYGSPDPNEQIMAVSPPVRPQGDEEKPDSRSFNFGLFGKPGEALHVVLDGLTFETPGASAVYVSGSHVTVRNSLFLGCRAGGVCGRSNHDGTQPVSDFITVEFCEWHSFLVFDDMKELFRGVRDGMIPVAPEQKRFHFWVHKSRVNGAASSYETGVIRRVGRGWTLRNCFIHDCFDGIANLNYARDTVIENNRFTRCIDNAVETENHASGCHIRANRFEDIFQSVSLQPLGGLPWPGPVYVYRNLFSRTPENSDLWGGAKSPFKLGVQLRQWKFAHLKEQLANVDPERIELPGLLIYNNTVIEPQSLLMMFLGGPEQVLTNTGFYNNLVVAGNLCARHILSGSGGPAAFSWAGNRLALTSTSPLSPPFLTGQFFAPAEVLPGWKQNDFLPAHWIPSVPVPGAPRQFRFAGALQSAEDEIAVKTGVQEEPQ